MNSIMSNNFKPLFKEEIKFKKFLDKKWLFNEIVKCESDLRNKRYDISTNVTKILENLLRDALLSQGKEELYLKSLNIKELIKECYENFSLEAYVCSSLHSLRSSRNNFSHSSDLSHHGVTEIDCANMLRSLQIVLYYFFKEIYQVNLNSEILGSFSLGVYNINKIENIITEKDIKEIANFSNNVIEDIRVNKIPIFSFLFGEIKKKFIVPIYQRGYDWDRENVEILCNDIFKRMRDDYSHYLGVIAVKRENNKLNNNSTIVKILDGQQRITTTLLLIMAIKTHIKEKYKENIDKIKMFKKIDDYLLNFKIKLGDIIDNPGGSSTLNNEFKNILDEKNIKFNEEYGINFLVIKEYLEKNLNSISDVIDFSNALEKRLTIAVVDFDPNYITTKKELEIFENLNSKGKSLESFDLIKNYLFNLCCNDVLEKKEKDIVVYFNTYIHSEFNSNTKETKEFFEHFIMYYSGSEIKGKNKDISTFKKFEKVIDNLLKDLNIDINSEGQEISDFYLIIDFISKYIPIYNQMRKKMFLNFQDYKIKPLLMSMSIKKLAPLYYVSFLVVDLFKNFEQLSINDKKNIGKIYILFIEYLTLKTLMTPQGDSEPKRVVCKICFETRNEFTNKNFKINELLEFITSKLKMEAKVKSNDFRERLISRRDDDWSTKTSLILMEYKISNYIQDNSSNMDFSEISLEHIMPQKIEKWNENIIEWNKNDFEEITLNNIQDYCMRYENMIGNFLVLNNDKNSSINNKKFNEKIEKYNSSNIINWKIYNYSIEKSLDVKNKNKWTFKNIEERTRFINDYFINELFKKLLD